MHTSALRLAPIALFALAFAGCADHPDSAVDGEAGGLLPDAAPADAFDHAEARTGVPADLLVAIAWAETRHQMVRGEAEFPGQQPAWGIMGLRGDLLARGAALAELGVEDARTDRAANILAAAWALADLAADEGIDPTDLGAWAPAVARYAGISHPDAVAAYVHDEVYAALNEGVRVDGIDLAAREVVADYPEPELDVLRATPDQPDALWTPSPNFNSRGGAKVDFIIIHTCEGTYTGCWSWLVNPQSGVSAHYVVNDNGTEVRQLVQEKDRAWHISANYDCANNFNLECWRNGTSMNTISVGIEHAGYASQTHWDSGLIQRSAELSCGVSQRQNIVRDSYHIVAHAQLQPWNRTDPGPNWPWTDYLNRIKTECGDIGPDPTQYFVIDSDNANNPDARLEVDPGNGWWASTNVQGYWGTGYLVAPTEPVSDPTAFEFNLPKDNVCLKVEAWWTAASDRSTTATYIGWDPTGAEVGRKTVNQQINGSRWNTLGSWRFDRGWNSVLLSRWTTSGYYVVADAIRLSKSTGCP